MNRSILPWITTALVLGLAACNSNSPPPDSIASNPTPTESVSPSPTPSEQPSASPTPTASPTASPETVTINIYQLDDQCNNYVEKQVPMPAKGTLEAVVGNVLTHANTADFPLAGYRVSVDKEVATIDLRLPPNARRTFRSLSSCEQLSLFGSLEKTLLNNPSLKIQAVRFVSGTEEIIL